MSQIVKGIARDDFTSATAITWYQAASDDLEPIADLDLRTLHIQSIHVKGGTSAQVDLWWGVVGDRANDGHIIEAGADGNIDKVYNLPNCMPQVPKGSAGTGVFVQGPGAGSTCVIYAIST